MWKGNAKAALLFIASGSGSGSFSVLTVTHAFQPAANINTATIINRSQLELGRYSTDQVRGTELLPLYSQTLSDTDIDTDIIEQPQQKDVNNDDHDDDQRFWELGPTLQNPIQPPLPPKLMEALEQGTHPIENQDDLGMGVFITKDWRKAYHSYGVSSSSHSNTNMDGEQDPAELIINPKTGYAEYDIDDSMIDGTIPHDLVGCLYRNGPGKFGVGGDRVQHVLDADGLIIKVLFPPPNEDNSDGSRGIKFQSRFVTTDAMQEEEDANEFLYRSTFGTAPRGYVKPPRNGLNEDPWEPPLLSRIAGSALKTDIKNSANTQVISFGGKLLALFEAGLPHQLDPKTLETVGEDTLGGVLKKGSPVKLDIPEQYSPDFIGGTAHTAHPNVCPDTGNLVGWHWSQLVSDGALEVTFTEWSKDDFSPVASKTFQVDNCQLAPHDMAMTENCIMLTVNALKMNTLNFLSGIKGPAASLEMDGRANVFVHVFPRPTAKVQFEPYVVEVPPCFSIHFSHAYEDEETGNLVAMFSGWPPSDEKDFLGAWGGFAPLFKSIPVTYIWKMEIDPVKKECVHLGIAPGAVNACSEHPLVHPNFSTKKAKYVYVSLANLIGDSTAPCGFGKLRVEDGAKTELPVGVKNYEVDSWFFGTRCFAGEPLIVPKQGADPLDEEAAYLLGMVHDTVNDRSGVAVFDLERALRKGPVATAWLKSPVPHGLHGCFAQDETGSSSVFC